MCCHGSCTAQVNLDCQLSCQLGEFSDCQSAWRESCRASCGAGGSLFCSGQLVAAGSQVTDCAAALVQLGHVVDIEVEVDPDIDLDIDSALDDLLDGGDGDGDGDSENDDGEQQDDQGGGGGGLCSFTSRTPNQDRFALAMLLTLGLWRTRRGC